MPSCYSCNPPSTHPDFGALALHIMSTKGHKKGRKWAAKYLMINNLSPEKRNGKQQGRIILTEEQKESKRDSRYQLSGENEVVVTICPKCKTGRKLALPVEFTGSPVAWRIKGLFAVLCSVCGG